MAKRKKRKRKTRRRKAILPKIDPSVIASIQAHNLINRNEWSNWQKMKNENITNKKG